MPWSLVVWRGSASKVVASLTPPSGRRMTPHIFVTVGLGLNAPSALEPSRFQVWRAQRGKAVRARARGSCAPGLDSAVVRLQRDWHLNFLSFGDSKCLAQRGDPLVPVLVPSDNTNKLASQPCSCTSSWTRFAHSKSINSSRKNGHEYVQTAAPQ